MPKSDPSSENKSDSPSGGSGGLRWLILAVVVGALFWFGLKAMRETPEVGAGADDSGAAPMGPPPATVLVATVQKQQAQERRSVTGTLRAVSRADVAAREPGRVAEVPIDEGRAVRKNDILAVLDRSRLDAELAEANARLRAAEAVVKQRAAEAKRASTDLLRKKELFSSGAVSEREFLDAEREAAVAVAGAEVATGELAAMTSSVDLMTLRSTDMEIRAPFDGRIVTRHVDPGEWLAVGSPVATLVSTGDIEAWLNVPERYAANIAEGGKNLQVISDASGLKSAITELRQVADIDPTTRLFPVVATIDDGDGQMVAGMAVTVDLPIGESSEHLAVPVDALVVSRGQAFVFCPQPGATAQQPPSAQKVLVRELFRSNGSVFVESDTLRTGDMVVTEGNERLYPGTPLIVVPADSEAKASVSADQP